MNRRWKSSFIRAAIDSSRIYDAAGRLVRALAEEARPAG